jgi:hypothetical protein
MNEGGRNTLAGNYSINLGDYGKYDFPVTVEQTPELDAKFTAAYEALRDAVLEVAGPNYGYYMRVTFETVTVDRTTLGQYSPPM